MATLALKEHELSDSASEAHVGRGRAQLGFAMGFGGIVLFACGMLAEHLRSDDAAFLQTRELSIPGVQPGKIVLGIDVNYPPYAQFTEGVGGVSGGLGGFGKDVGEGVGKVCNLDITFTQTNWKQCWDADGYRPGSPGIGVGLSQGWFHGCSTYTHTQGVRNRFLDFTDPILNSNKPAGLLTRVKNGVPHVNGLSDLAGKKIVDVGGWAPVADGLDYVENKCTKQKYVKACKEAGGSDCYTLLTVDGNDNSMRMLRNGSADAVFIYADQAEHFVCDKNGKSETGADPNWNCSLWAGFGKEYAYVQTGQFQHAISGTTLAFSKKGSGLPAILNPCIKKFLQTKEYYDLCVKYDLEDTCFSNDFFPTPDATHKVKPHPYMLPTDQHTVPGCADGYCSCPKA